MSKKFKISKLQTSYEARTGERLTLLSVDSTDTCQFAGEDHPKVKIEVVLPQRLAVLAEKEGRLDSVVYEALDAVLSSRQYFQQEGGRPGDGPGVPDDGAVRLPDDGAGKKS
jgi:hypothetical protein